MRKLVPFRGWNLDDDDEDEAELRNVFAKRVKPEPVSPQSSQSKLSASTTADSQVVEKARSTKSNKTNKDRCEKDSDEEDPDFSDTMQNSNTRTVAKQTPATSGERYTNKTGAFDKKKTVESSSVEISIVLDSDDDLDSATVGTRKLADDIGQATIEKTERVRVESKRKSPSPGPRSQQRKRARSGSPESEHQPTVRVKTETKSPTNSQAKNTSGHQTRKDLSAQPKTEEIEERATEVSTVKTPRETEKL